MTAALRGSFTSQSFGFCRLSFLPSFIISVVRLPRGEKGEKEKKEPRDFSYSSLCILRVQRISPGCHSQHTVLTWVPVFSEFKLEIIMEENK